METEANVDDLIDLWEEMRHRGTPQTVDELCAGRPELAAELRRRIEALQAMDSALDTQVREPPPAAGRGYLGGGAPEVLRATAVYHTRSHHDHWPATTPRSPFTRAIWPVVTTTSASFCLSSVSRPRH
jgi:hypothetical protein